MGLFDSILSNLGYIRLSEFNERLTKLRDTLKLSNERLRKAVTNNQPKTAT